MPATVHTFSSVSTTLAIPANADMLFLEAVGGSGSGGSGRRGAPGTLRTGGTGGHGGHYTSRWITATPYRGTNLTINVGTGGFGASAPPDNTNGVNGNRGQDSLIYDASGNLLLRALGGSGGLGGSNGAVTPVPISPAVAGHPGGAPGNILASGVNNLPSSSAYGGGAGGNGGSITAANVAEAGSDGARGFTARDGVAAAGSPGVGGAGNVNGTAPTNGDFLHGAGGGGGNAAGASVIDLGGGGGGGGGCTNTGSPSTNPISGAGGRGIIRITVLTP